MPEKVIFNLEILERTVLETLGTNKEKLFAKSHNRKMAYLRSIMFYFLKKYTNLSLEMIGGRYNRDHCTVMYSIKNLHTYRKYEEWFDQKIKTLEEKFEGNSKIMVCTHCGREL